MGMLEVEDEATDDVLELLGTTDDDDVDFEVLVTNVVEEDVFDVLLEITDELEDFVETTEELELDAGLLELLDDEIRLDDDDNVDDDDDDEEEDSLDVLVITDDELSVEDLDVLDDVLDLELLVAGAVDETLETVGGGGGVPGGAIANSLFCDVVYTRVFPNAGRWNFDRRPVAGVV